MLRVVGIGGGTGLPVLLGGLKQLSRNKSRSAPSELSISAIVSTADSGGSSGLLRETFNIPAVGDVRNCLVTLAGGNSILVNLFQHRFPGNGLKGHSLGNLIITALYQQTGSLMRAVERAGDLLKLKGFVFPMTEAGVNLCAEVEDGTEVRGEARIPTVGKTIRRVWLEPENPLPSVGLLATIASADVIALGPGSLFTSIIPNLLVAGVAETIRTSRALKIFVCNLMTEPGETDHFTAADHVRQVENYLGHGVLDVCLMNAAPVHPSEASRYLATGSEAVQCDKDGVARLGVVPIAASLLPAGQFFNTHDPQKLARLILFLARRVSGCRELASTHERWVS